MTYPIISASELVRPRRSYPRLSWPIDQLQVGDAFVVPMVDGHDRDGRSEAYIRVLVGKAANRLFRRFAVNKHDGSLAISRTA